MVAFVCPYLCLSRDYDSSLCTLPSCCHDLGIGFLVAVGDLLVYRAVDLVIVILICSVWTP